MKIWRTDNRRSLQQSLVSARQKMKLWQKQLGQRFSEVPKSPIFFSAVASLLGLVIFRGTGNVESPHHLTKVKPASPSRSVDYIPPVLITQSENPPDANPGSEDSGATVVETEESRQ